MNDDDDDKIRRKLDDWAKEGNEWITEDVHVQLLSLNRAQTKVRHVQTPKEFSRERADDF